jgi:hypothetical protein
MAPKIINLRRHLPRVQCPQQVRLHQVAPPGAVDDGGAPGQPAQQLGVDDAFGAEVLKANRVGDISDGELCRQQEAAGVEMVKTWGLATPSSQGHTPFLAPPVPHSDGTTRAQ